MIKTIINEFEKSFFVTRISGEELLDLSCGKDIDYYADEEDRKTIIHFFQDRDFFITENSKYKVKAKKYLESKLYVVDIAFNFNYLTELFPNVQLTEKFALRAKDDRAFENFFQHVLFLRSTPKHLASVSEGFDLYFQYFYNSEFITGSIFYENFSKQRLLGVLKKKPLDMLLGIRTFHLLILLLGHRYRKLKTFNTGSIVALVGPDGSGKTTVIDRLNVGGSSKRMYMGDWGFLFQPMYAYLHTKHIAIARLSYFFYYIENWLRYFRAMVCKLRGYTVLMDRYPGMNRHTGKRNIWLHINNVMYVFFPKPDKLIFISAPPKVIHARKQDVTIEEIRLSQEFLRSKVINCKYALEIRNVDLDDCLNRAYQFIHSRHWPQIPTDEM